MMKAVTTLLLATLALHASLGLELDLERILIQAEEDLKTSLDSQTRSGAQTSMYDRKKFTLQ